MDLFEPDSFRFPNAMKGIIETIKRLPRHKSGEKFLKGPIPWDWVSMASKLPGKALHVANALWFIAGIKNCRTIALSGKVLRGMGVKRNAAYRGLTALEASGLVSVIKYSGRCPVVTINDFKDVKVNDEITMIAT